MFKILVFFIILNFYSSVEATIKEKIISKLEQTNNLSFDFKQTINKKITTLNNH